jgi:hypothetical protein
MSLFELRAAIEGHIPWWAPLALVAVVYATGFVIARFGRRK